MRVESTAPPSIGLPRIPDIAGASPAAAGVEAQASDPVAEQQRVERVAADFTAVLTQQLVREMFESVKEGEGPFGSGPGADIQRSVAETAFSQSLAENGLDSLRAAIERAISRSQANAAAAVTTTDPSSEESLQ